MNDSIVQNAVADLVARLEDVELVALTASLVAHCLGQDVQDALDMTKIKDDELTALSSESDTLCLDQSTAAALAHAVSVRASAAAEIAESLRSASTNLLRLAWSMGASADECIPEQDDVRAYLETLRTK